MKKRSNFKMCIHLIGLVKPLLAYMILAVIMGLVGHLCATFITIFGGYAVLKLLNFEVAMTLNVIFICICIFAVARGALHYGEQSCNHFIAFKLLALIRDKVFKALRNLCPAKLEGEDKGNLISVITSDIELLEVFYAHTISPIIIAFIMSIIMSLFIGSFHFILGLIAALAYIVVGVILPVIISKNSGKDGMNFRTKSGELSSFVLDSLRGLAETLQYNMQGERLYTMNQKTEELLEHEKRMKLRTGLSIGFTNMVIVLFDALLLFSATFLYKNGVIEFSGVLIPVIALMSSFGPVIALSSLGSTLQNTFAAGNRVLDILDESPSVEEIKGQQEVCFNGAETENIVFSYGGDTILSDVSINILENSVVGIIGRSGSGKSTLLKLLMRFWTVQKGCIKISDTPIDEINTWNLREMESFVTQETHLFHDSIQNNIRIAKLDATEDEIITACNKAGIHDFIMKLERGYETQVGELGDTLSGGERQRIGLARAFLHNAPFMLLDEPTSNLDSLNEAVILRSIREEHGEKTVVLVSHRESTMRVADRVYNIEHGRIS